MKDKRMRPAHSGSSRYADKADYSLRELGAYGVRTVRRKKGSSQTLIICSVIILILMISCVTGGLILYKNAHGVPDITVDLEQLDSPYAMMMDAKTGNVIASKRGDEIIFPASMTKILTVLTAIEHIKNLDQKIMMDPGLYDALYAADASRAGFEPGEEVVVRDLLYGALLPSGAECCIQLAVTAAGSESAFVDLMNRKVSSLGLTQSHFTNTTGLHDDDQYSTVKEIGLILREALKNKIFYQVFTTHSYKAGASGIHPDGFSFESSMFKYLGDQVMVTGGEILGGKTGFTQAAGHCLASMAKIKRREYILVTAGWAEYPKTENYHISDAVTAYNALGQALG